MSLIVVELAEKTPLSLIKSLMSEQLFFTMDT
jgi:hypothetical protein